MVPKLIHHIVGPSANDLVQDCLDSWKEVENIGFSIMIWDDTKIETFINSEFEFALGAFLSARNHGEAADIARYLIVYNYGGYYVDWDIKLLSVEKFRSLHYCYPKGYLLLDPSNGTYASEHFSSLPREQILLDISKDIVDTFRRDERELMNTPHYSGPFRMRSSMKRHPFTNQAILPVKDVFQFDYSEIRNVNRRIKKKKAMIHYWMHSWVY